MSQKKFCDVIRYGHKTTKGIFNIGDPITVTEKIDGANASFKRDGDKVLAFSRNNPLDESNNLGGFYQWVQANIDPKKLLDGVIYFGEWLNPHKVKYAPEHTKTFILFAIFNEFTQEYVNFSMVKDEARRLNLKLVPVFYEGEYQSFEHLQSFVGRTELGGVLGGEPMGEGVVIVNYDYKDKYGNQIFTKMVVEKFREVQSQKEPRDPNTPESIESLWVKDNMTKARVEKMLHKLVDEGIIEEEFGIEDMGTILKNINRRLIEDMIKEEVDYLPEGYEQKEIGRAVAAKSPTIIKEIIKERQV
jgi:hypothetical protein